MRRLAMPRVAFYASIGLTIALCLLVSPRLAPAASFAWPQSGLPDDSSPIAANADTPELAGNVGLKSANAIIVLVSGTNVTATTGSNVAIGEVITYSVVITVNDNSTYGNVVLTSTLSDGLAFVSCAQITAHASITTSITGSFPAVCASPTVINSGRNITFTFGEVRNANTYAGSAEAVTVQFTAVVLNTSDNNAGDILTAKARWKWSTPSSGNVSSSENVVIYEPSLTLSKSGGTGTPRTGQNVAFTLDLTNDSTVTSPAVAYDVVVTDTIPSGMTYANNVTVLQGKAPDSFVADTGSGVITATWNYVAPGDLIRLRYYATVNGDVPARTVITNTAGIVASSIPGAPAQPISSYNTSSTERTGYDLGSQADGYRHNDYAIVTVTTPDLVITKSDGVTSAAPGDTLTYTIRVTNTGNYHADNVVVTETVPANAVFLASPRSSSGWSCANHAPAGATCLYAFSGTNNPLNAGASVSALRFVVKVTDTVPVGSISITNTVKVGDDGIHGVDPTPANNTVSDVDGVSGQIDLTLTKVDSGAATAGNPITYTIVYTNLGTTTATDVVLTETVPVSTSYSSGAPWTCTPSGAAGGVCTRALPDLGGGARGSATFTVTVANPTGVGMTTIANTAAIGVPGGADVDTSNNSATITTTVNAAPDMVVTKKDNGAATPGNQIVYTIAYTNAGNQNATGVVLTETVPQNTTYSGSGWTCAPSSAAGSVCTRSIGNLAGGGGGGSVTFAVTVAYPLAAGVDSVANMVTVGDDNANGADVDTSNNAATITTTVNAAPDLVISKTDNGAATPGNQIVYTIVYTNAGNQNATGVVLTETVPQNTTYSGSGWTCAPSSAAGSVCTHAIGDLGGGGASGSAVFAVTVDTTLAAGIDGVANTVSIGDDNANGADVDTSNNAATISTTVNAAPDLVISKTDNGAATPGNQVVYTIVYTNAGNQNATGVVLTETVPQNTTYSGSGWTCAPSSAAGSVCTRLIGNLAGGGAAGSVTFAVTVGDPLATGIDSVANTVSIGDDKANGADVDTSNNAATITTTVNAAPDLVISKTDNGAATPGNQIVYTIVYTNAGNQNATGVVLTETVPQNTTYSGSGWTCAPSSAAGSVCTHAIGDLGGGGASGSAVFAVTVDTTLAAGIDGVANTVSIGDDNANGADVDTSNNAVTITTTVNAAPDLVISKTDNGAATPGNQVVYTIAYTNAGNQNATGVVLTETVPQNTTYSGSGWSCSPSSAAGSVCTRLIGNLAGGGAAGSVTFAVTVGDPLATGVDSIANMVTVGDDNANGADPTPGDNNATITTTVNAAPDMVVTKKDNGAATPGNQIVYTIAYTNAGNQNATGVVLTETVPQNTTYSGSGWSCSPSGAAGSVCTHAIGDLGGGGASGSAVFAVTVDTTVPAGIDSIANTVSIGDDGANGADVDTSNNAATITTPITAAPDLAISKSDGGVGTTPGGAIQYTLYYTNSGNQGVTGVVVTETVPAGTLFNASASNSAWACMPDGGAGHTCLLTIAGLAAGSCGTISFTVTVTDPLPTGQSVVTNSVRIGDNGANGADPTPDDRVASDSTLVTSAPELQISKRADTQNALPASVVKFTLSYTNAGNVGASGVTISETVPALSAFSAGDSAAGWTCSSINPGGVCTLDAGMVDGRGGHGAAVFAVKLFNPIDAQFGPITVTNSATIGDDGSNGVDPNPLNNAATTVIDVTPTYFDKFAWASTAGQGYAARYTIVLHNTGAEAMQNVVVSDLLPLNVRLGDATVAVVSSAMPSVFSGWAASGGVYDGNRTVEWNVGEVPPGRYVAIKVLVYVYSGTPVGTVLTNTAILSASGQPAITATSQVVVVASGQTRPPEPTTTPAPTPPSALCPAGDGARVDVGSAISYTDSFGHIWAADRAYAPGQNTWGYTAEGFVYATQHAIAATDDPQLYQTERWWPASGGYRFDVPNGNYLVTLKLAEVYPWATIGSRVFTVTIENTAVVSHLDVVRIAGQYTAYDATFSVTVQDGVLNVDIRSEQGSPSLKAIMFERVVTCGTGGAATPTATPQPPVSAGPTPTPTPGTVDAPRCVPLRIDAGATAAHTDGAGDLWLADQRYVSGATTWGYKGLSAVYNSSAAIAATSDPLLYRSERWWEQSGGYDIELANGSYQVTLKFAEIYPWASSGSRAFDVKIEDALVLSHLDVFGQAGANVAYDLTLTAVVNDGLLSIDVVRQHGSPAINGVVVTPLTGCGNGG